MVFSVEDRILIENLYKCVKANVYRCECQSDLLLVLQGTVGAQKNRCGEKYNTGFITIFLRCITAKIIQIGPGSTKLLQK